MASPQDSKGKEDDDIHHKIITEILKICTEGCTKQNIMEQTQLSHDQLKRIMAEIVDREILQYIEARRIYITSYFFSGVASVLNWLFFFPKISVNLFLV